MLTVSNKLKIEHRLPGRVRLYIEGLKGKEALGHFLETELSQLPWIQKVKASPQTGRALVFFNEAEGRSLLNQVSALMQRWVAVPGRQPEKETKVFEPEDLPVRYQLAQVVGSGLVLALLTAKRLFYGKASPERCDRYFGLAALTTIVAGYPIFRSGLEYFAKKGKMNNDFLISTATLVSLFLRESITGLVVVWLVNLSSLFQTLTLDRSRRAIREILQGKEQDAWLIVDGVRVSAPARQVKPGNLVAVHTGEKIPVDGIVRSGQGQVNQAPITGESIPVTRQTGEEVHAGTILEDGYLEIEALRVGEDTTVGRIIHLVEQAGEVRAPIENLADRYSEKIVPLSLGLAGAIYLLTRDFRRAVTMLIVACPCAAGLATPTAISAALGNAARKGILVKGGSYLQGAGEIDAVLFDKTGTLTTGKPKVTEVITLTPESSQEEILTLAASAEACNQHPVAQAVRQLALEAGIQPPAPESQEIQNGRGVRAAVHGRQVLVGSPGYMAEQGIKLLKAQKTIKKLGYWAQSACLVAVDGQLLGVVAVEDQLKPQSMEAIQLLRLEGVELLGLVSGDAPEPANRVADTIGVDRVWSQVLPEGKVAIVRELQQEGKKVAMVGEGINDSPALAVSDLGIAMGTGGTDVAIEAADIVLAGDDPRKVAEVIKLSKNTLQIIRQNFLFAVGINSLGLILGAGKLISPLTGALLHNLATFGVVVNSTRLLNYGTRKPSRGRPHG